MWLWFLDRQAGQCIKNPHQRKILDFLHWQSGDVPSGDYNRDLERPLLPIVSIGKVVFAVQYQAQIYGKTKTSSCSPKVVGAEICFLDLGSESRKSGPIYNLSNVELPYIF